MREHKVSIRHKPWFLNKIYLQDIIGVAWNQDALVHRLAALKLTQNFLVDFSLILQMVIFLSVNVTQLDKFEIKLIANYLSQSFTALVIVPLQAYNWSTWFFVQIGY